jgi:hypothetical protein
VLQTRWLSDRAVVEITDLLPIGDTEDDLPMLMRRVRVVSGRATFRLRCAVRHDYARAKTLARLDGKDVIFSAADQPSLRLSTDQPDRRQRGGHRIHPRTGSDRRVLLGAIDDPRFRRAPPICVLSAP